MDDDLSRNGLRQEPGGVPGDSFPHSLGLLYSAFTYFTGFKVNSGEYKLMGLAPYGQPKYKKLILEPDGSFWLDLSYFDYCTGLTMTNECFSALFGEPAQLDALLTEFHMDVAASIQAVLDEVVLRLLLEDPSVAALSSMASANSFFSLAFSLSSPFNRLALETSSPHTWLSSCRRWLH